MINDFNDIKLAYSTKDIAQKTNQSKPVIRKYGQMLEAAGYKFIKNGNRRIFVEADVFAMIEMKKSGNITRTAIELAENQKNKNVIESDSFILLNDTCGLQQEKYQAPVQVVQNDRCFNVLAERISKIIIDIEVTHEMIQKVIKSSESILNEVLEAKKRDKEAKKELELIKENLDFVVNLIQSKENLKKKSIWQRLFG